jgi:Spy/CpxP family protein refolding chaperone
MSVTTAGLTRGGRLSKRRVLAAALAISVALNLCVVAGVVWHRFYAPPPPQGLTARLHRLADTLDLTPQQRVAFDHYIADMVTRGERMHQEIQPMMDSAWAEIAKPDADKGRVLQLLDSVGDQRRAFMHEAVDATASLLATLTPEQRAKFVTEERAFHSAQRRRHAEEAR